MIDEKPFLKTNVEVVAMKVKFLETISIYEKRCVSLLVKFPYSKENGMQ